LATCFARYPFSPLVPFVSTTSSIFDYLSFYEEFILLLLLPETEVFDGFCWLPPEKTLMPEMDARQLKAKKNNFSSMASRSFDLNSSAHKTLFSETYCMFFVYI